MLFLKGQDTVESVLAIRAKAISTLRDGGEVVSWNVEGAGANLLITLPAREVIEECNEFLRLMLPTVYGPRVKRTIPVFL